MNTPAQNKTIFALTMHYSCRSSLLCSRKRRRRKNMDHALPRFGRILLFVIGMLSLVVVRVESQGDVFHHNHHHHHHHHDDDDDFCGTEVPSLEKERIDQLRVDAFHAVTDGTYDRRRKLQTESCDELCNQCIEIEVYLHIIGTDLGFGPIIPHPESAVERARRNVNDVTVDDFATGKEIIAMFEENIKVVNEAYSDTPFRFKFVREGTTQTINERWSQGASEFKDEMSKMVGNADFRKLDCFVSSSLRASKGRGETLGTATLPGSQVAGKGDGVYIRYDVLPGGGRLKNDLGYTLVHEIGHWLGLLHTFQQLATTDPCDAEEVGYGDFVDDTPIHNGPSSRLIDDCRKYLGGATLPDSCPNLPGKDPLFNMMNYAGWEECLAEEGYFSCGQKERMHKHWLLFRDQVTSCEDPYDMEIEVMFTFDRFHGAQNSIRLVNDKGQNIFDSVRDHYVAYTLEKEESLYIDICMPRHVDYKMIVMDTGGNGFVNGNIEVFIDRSVTQTVRGNFGEKMVVNIPSQPLRTMAPTVSLAPSFSLAPSREPSAKPSYSHSPTISLAPSLSKLPSAIPSVSHAPSESFAPTATALPSAGPTFPPSIAPSTLHPSGFPSASPISPSSMPSATPSDFPSLVPSIPPSSVPTDTPTLLPSNYPSTLPTQVPSSESSSLPSQSPSHRPSALPSSLSITAWSEPTFVPDSATVPSQQTVSTSPPSYITARSSGLLALVEEPSDVETNERTKLASSSRSLVVSFAVTICALVGLYIWTR